MNTKKMMTAEQNYIIFLLRKSLNPSDEAMAVPPERKEMTGIISRNSILLTVFPLLPEDMKEQLYNSFLAAVTQSVNQGYEGNQVLNALSDAGFSCIALKGWEMRKLYPKTTMRQMADLDILVRPYKYGSIKAVMDSLDYKSGSEGNWKHDSFKKNEIHVEMHKRLTDDSDVIQVWEKGIWDRAERINGNIYRMSSEDYYIFHFVHLYKDFMNGSLGLRRVVDTWLLQKQPVDMKIVEEKLESFGMWRFHERMVKLSRVTMGDEPMDENSELLLTHAFKHGIYGSRKSYKAGRIASMGGSVRSGKAKSKLSALFLPYRRMKAQYPVLQKWPVLLPFCWGKRIVRFLRGDMERHKRMLDYSDISEADFFEMKRFFEAGGVM